MVVAEDDIVLLCYLLNDDAAQAGPFSGSYTFDKTAQQLQGARTP